MICVGTLIICMCLQNVLLLFVPPGCYACFTFASYSQTSRGATKQGQHMVQSQQLASPVNIQMFTLTFVRDLHRFAAGTEQAPLCSRNASKQQKELLPFAPVQH